MAYDSACRQPDGSWKISGSADPAGVAKYWRPPGYAPPYYDCPYPHPGHFGCGYPYYYYGSGGPYYSFGYAHHFRY